MPKLRAIHTQTIQPIATRAHVKVLDHAFIFTGISLRGYPSSLQAFQCAKYQNLETSHFHACIDPRTHQTSVFEALEQELVSYFNQCKKEGVAPEIWLANHSSFRHLEAICDRLTIMQKYPNLSSILQYLTQRYHYGGSQTLLCLSQVLKRHWVTAQPDTKDESLESWQNWLHETHQNEIPEHNSTFCIPIKKQSLPSIQTSFVP